MSWIAKHGDDVFFFFAFPLVGLVLDAFATPKRLFIALGCACLLVVPAATEYTYTFSWGYRLFCFAAFSCAYSLFSKQIEDNNGKIWAACLSAVVLFLVLGFFSMFSSFAGSQTVEKKWKTEDYRIEYIRDQGFAGGPLMKYELSEYAQIPFFLKKIETAFDNDSIESCKVVFTENKIELDKCTGTIQNVMK